MRAASDVVVVALPNESFLTFISADAKVAVALYRDASARLMLALDLMQVFMLQKAQHKILRLLWTSSEPHPSIPKARLALLSQAELARASRRDRRAKLKAPRAP